MRVTWDDHKNRANQEKHGVSFEEASTLFLSGADFLEICDEAHSDREDRYVAIGIIVRGLVVVVWTERYDETTRIISARWATAHETARYHAYRVDPHD